MSPSLRPFSSLLRDPSALGIRFVTEASREPRSGGALCPDGHVQCRRTFCTGFRHRGRFLPPPTPFSMASDMSPRHLCRLRGAHFRATDPGVRDNGSRLGKGPGGSEIGFRPSTHSAAPPGPRGRRRVAGGGEPVSPAKARAPSGSGPVVAPLVAAAVGCWTPVPSLPALESHSSRFWCFFWKTSWPSLEQVEKGGRGAGGVAGKNQGPSQPHLWEAVLAPETVLHLTAPSATSGGTSVSQRARRAAGTSNSGTAARLPTQGPGGCAGRLHPSSRGQELRGPPSRQACRWSSTR